MHFRKATIAVLVFLHFSFGILTLAPPEAPFFQLPGVASILNFYDNNSLEQHWIMFAPPSTYERYIGYSLFSKDGWTELKDFDEKTHKLTSGHLIVPRGLTRLGTHTRYPISNSDIDIDKNSHARNFFQRLASYYCFGDGRVPDLKKIRFYSVYRGIEPFYATLNGKPAPSARDLDRQLPIYEMNCESDEKTAS